MGTSTNRPGRSRGTPDGKEKSRALAATPSLRGPKPPPGEHDAGEA